MKTEKGIQLCKCAWNVNPSLLDWDSFFCSWIEIKSSNYCLVERIPYIWILSHLTETLTSFIKHLISVASKKTTTNTWFRLYTLCKSTFIYFTMVFIFFSSYLITWYVLIIRKKFSHNNNNKCLTHFQMFTDGAQLCHAHNTVGWCGNVATYPFHTWLTCWWFCFDLKTAYAIFRSPFTMCWLFIAIFPLFLLLAPDFKTTINWFLFYGYYNIAYATCRLDSLYV